MKIIAYTEITENGLLIHYPTKEVKAEIEHLYQGAKEKYNGYMTVTLDKPYKIKDNGGKVAKTIYSGSWWNISAMKMGKNRK